MSLYETPQSKRTPGEPEFGPRFEEVMEDSPLPEGTDCKLNRHDKLKVW